MLGKGSETALRLLKHVESFLSVPRCPEHPTETEPRHCAVISRLWEHISGGLRPVAQGSGASNGPDDEEDVRVQRAALAEMQREDARDLDSHGAPGGS